MLKFSMAHRFSQPPERVFEGLRDPRVLNRVLRGAKGVTRVGKDEYDVRFRVRAAGFSGTYDGSVRLVDMVPPESFTIIVEGGSFLASVRGAARVKLERKGPGTDLKGQGEAKVGGLLGGVGARLLEGKVERIIDDFFKRLEAELK